MPGEELRPISVLCALGYDINLKWLWQDQIINAYKNAARTLGFFRRWKRYFNSNNLLLYIWHQLEFKTTNRIELRIHGWIYVCDNALSVNVWYSSEHFVFLSCRKMLVEISEFTQVFDTISITPFIYNMILWGCELRKNGLIKNKWNNV